MSLGGGGLARSSLTDVDDARAHRDALVAHAAAVQRAAGHDPDRGGCAEAGCGLTGIPDGPGICALTQRLARLHDGHVPATTLDEAVSDLRAALPVAVDAVRECRRSMHTSSRCWFADLPGLDGCADVLRAAHRFGP